MRTVVTGVGAFLSEVGVLGFVASGEAPASKLPWIFLAMFVGGVAIASWSHDCAAND